MIRFTLYTIVISVVSFTFLRESSAVNQPFCASLFQPTTQVNTPLYKNLMKAPLSRQDLLSDLKSEPHVLLGLLLSSQL